MSQQPVVSAVDIAVRRARLAVAACFFLNAVFYANLIPRLPEVKLALGLSSTAYGLAIAALPLGALVAGLSAAPAIRRFGSGPVASIGLVFAGIAVWAAAVAQNWFALAFALLFVGALDAIVDVAQNAHALRVQRLYGRSIINSFHGIWSIGAVSGGLLGSAAAGLGIPLATHLAITAVLFGAVSLLISRGMLPGSDTEDSEGSTETTGGSGLRAVAKPMAMLGILAVCGAIIEDAGSSWSALFFRTELDASPAVAGLGFVSIAVAMTIGRLTGDRVVDRFGQRRVARVGGFLGAVGMGLALAVPTVPTAMLGFALAGLGVATLVPAVYQAAHEMPGLAHGTGLTLINWLLRVGFLASPPIVGAVSDASSLRVGLVVVVLAGVGMLVLGRALSARPSTH